MFAAVLQVATGEYTATVYCQSPVLIIHPCNGHKTNRKLMSQLTALSFVAQHFGKNQSSPSVGWRQVSSSVNCLQPPPAECITIVLLLLLMMMLMMMVVIMMMSLPAISHGSLCDDDDDNDENDGDDVVDDDDDITSCCLTCLSVGLSFRKLQGDVQTDRPLPGGHRL